MADPRPILIAGGGIGGLAAALALARAGFRTEVLEQADAFRETGAGIQMGPNFFTALNALGLRARTLADVWRPGALVMRDALTGAHVTDVPLGAEFESHFGNPYAVTHRGDLHTAMLEACQSHPLVDLRTGARLEDFNQNAESVAVRLIGGETRTGRALIGADGLWSSVRGKILGDGKPRVSGHIAYRAVLKREDVPEDLWSPDVVLWAGPRSHLVHYPLRRGELFNLVAVFHSDHYSEGWDEAADTSLLWRHFQGQRPEVIRLLEKIETWRMWVLCDREPVADWCDGRVALLGDAAHPMLQYLAQGAAMATEDAVCLAQQVVEHPHDLPAAFRAYNRARYLRTGRVQLTARFYGDVYHARGVTAELRSLLLAGRSARQTWAGMAWLYGGTGVQAYGGTGVQA